MTCQEAWRNKFVDRSLCVRGLHPKVTDEMLRVKFGKHGAISSAKVMLKDGRSRCFGFVCFENPEDARNAQQALNGHTLHGTRCTLQVSIWKPREETDTLMRARTAAASVQMPMGPRRMLGALRLQNLREKRVVHGMFVPSNAEPPRGYGMPIVTPINCVYPPQGMPLQLKNYPPMTLYDEGFPHYPPMTLYDEFPPQQMYPQGPPQQAPPGVFVPGCSYISGGGGASSFDDSTMVHHAASLTHTYFRGDASDSERRKSWRLEEKEEKKKKKKKEKKTEKGVTKPKQPVPMETVPAIPIGGFIFFCNNETMAENLENNLFGLVARWTTVVKMIQVGTPLFLYNYTNREMHGGFVAASAGDLNIDPNAWLSASFGNKPKQRRGKKVSRTAVASSLTSYSLMPHAHRSPTVYPPPHSPFLSLPPSILQRKTSPFPAQVRVDRVRDYAPLPFARIPTAALTIHAEGLRGNPRFDHVLRFSQCEKLLATFATVKAEKKTQPLATTGIERDVRFVKTHYDSQQKWRGASVIAVEEALLRARSSIADQKTVEEPAVQAVQVAVEVPQAAQMTRQLQWMPIGTMMQQQPMGMRVRQQQALLSPASRPPSGLFFEDSDLFGAEQQQMEMRGRQLQATPLAAPAAAALFDPDIPLTVDQLAVASPQQAKNMIGERLNCDLIRRTFLFASRPELCRKITGMLLDGMEICELLYLLESQDALDNKVEETLRVFRAAEEARV